MRNISTNIDEIFDFRTKSELNAILLLQTNKNIYPNDKMSLHKIKRMYKRHIKNAILNYDISTNIIEKALFKLRDKTYLYGKTAKLLEIMILYSFDLETIEQLMKKYFSIEQVSQVEKYNYLFIKRFCAIKIFTKIIAQGEFEKSKKDIVRAKLYDILEYLAQTFKKQEIISCKNSIENTVLKKTLQIKKEKSKASDYDVNLLYNGCYATFFTKHYNKIKIIQNGSSLYHNHTADIGKSTFVKKTHDGLFCTTAALIRNLSGEFRDIEFAVNKPFSLSISFSIDAHFLFREDKWLFFENKHKTFAIRCFGNDDYRFIAYSGIAQIHFQEKRKKGNIFVVLLESEDKKKLLRDIQFVDENYLKKSQNFVSVYNNFKKSEREILKNIITFCHKPLFSETMPIIKPIIMLDFIESGYYNFLEKILTIKRIAPFFCCFDLIVLINEPYYNSTLIKKELEKLLQKSKFYDVLNDNKKLHIYTNLSESAKQAIKNASVSFEFISEKVDNLLSNTNGTNDC